VLSFVQHINMEQAAGRLTRAIFCAALLSFAPISFANAQTTEKTQDNAVQTTDGLNLNLSAGVLSSDLNGGFNSTNNLINLPANSIGSTLFKLDISDPNCLSGVGQCLRRDDQIKLGLQTQFTSVSDKGFRGRRCGSFKLFSKFDGPSNARAVLLAG